MIYGKLVMEVNSLAGARLIEERLSDKSLVYNIEFYLTKHVIPCIDKEDAFVRWNLIFKACN